MTQTHPADPSTPQPPPKLTNNPQALKTFIDQFDTFLFDCDGVLWSGPQLLPNVRETLLYLHSLNKTLLFVTNNSTKSRASYLDKFTSLSIAPSIPITTSQIFSSSYSAALYISRILRLPSSKRVYILGESGIEEELTLAGISHFGGSDPTENRPLSDADLETFGPDPTVGAVLCGLDRNLNYRKLSKAFHYLTHPDTLFLATNIDSTFPSHGKLFPGAGTTAAPLVTMLGGREPTSFGKPSLAMMDAIEAGTGGFERSRACMVGDRLNTDIKFGVEAGLGGTLAVLTGVVKEEEVVRGEGGVWAGAYVETLGDLLKAREAEE
ncbi:2-phosphoglycolate phosphatase [Ascodesmis nigricans]|uniref:4-nitrophenylphosphatase n=1 Tax=Ascodesmis nigricans TaxID=341454 RepID=A0A4S2MQI3_9PEZI|nr:2-phosphoglycolate phosphatase [Ascodesmis nigricans]